MKNQLNEILSGIRTMMSAEIESIRQEGKANDERAIDAFRQALSVLVLLFKDATASYRRHTPDDGEFDSHMLQMLEALLGIMRSPRPDVVKVGFYVSPDRPTDALYFWAYQDLYELCEWIQACTRRRDPLFISLEYLVLVRLEFDALTADEATLRAQGTDDALLKVLMRPFREIRSAKVVTLKHSDLANLRKLKAAIHDCCMGNPNNVNEALQLLLCEFNVNTRESMVYFRDSLKRALDGAATEYDKRQILVLHEQMIQQAIVESNMGFDPYRDPLVLDVQKLIEAQYTLLAKRSEDPDTTTVKPADAPVAVKLAVTNEHHAAHMHVLHEVGYFHETDAVIIEQSGRWVVSSSNLPLGMKAFRKNFHTPTGKGITATFDTL